MDKKNQKWIKKKPMPHPPPPPGSISTLAPRVTVGGHPGRNSIQERDILLFFSPIQSIQKVCLKEFMRGTGALFV